MNEQLYVTSSMLEDIRYFLRRLRVTNSDAVTFAYPNGEYLNIRIIDNEITMKIYR